MEVLPQADWAPLPQETCEELLALAHHRDFVLFCALLDGEFLGAEGRLLLELPHRYVYEVLSLSRHRSALADLFSRYDGGVFLRCGTDVIACSQSGRKGEDEPLMEGASVEEEPVAAAVQASEPRDAPAGREAALPFDGLVREVARWMNGEVVLVKRGADDSDGEAIPEEDKDDE